MNRREFIQTTMATGITTAIPMVTSAKEIFKYPLIGQPLFGIIINSWTWNEISNPNNKYFPHNRIHSVHSLYGDQVEVFVHKIKSPFEHPDRVQLSSLVAYGASTIVDMENYVMLKCRDNGWLGPMKIPTGANKHLVMENRKKWSI